MFGLSMAASQGDSLLANASTLLIHSDVPDEGASFVDSSTNAFTVTRGSLHLIRT